MQVNADMLIQSLPDEHLDIFARRLTAWLLQNEGPEGETADEFTDSRAKAILRTTDLLDSPTLNSFFKLMTNVKAIRILLAQLLKDNALANEDDIQTLASIRLAGPNR